NNILKVTPGGTVSTFVSSGIIHSPNGLAFDAAGNLSVANNSSNTIVKVTPAGGVSLFVASGLTDPRGLVFDAAGNLYVAEASINTIGKVTPAGVLSPYFSGLSSPRQLA